MKGRGDVLLCSEKSYLDVFDPTEWASNQQSSLFYESLEVNGYALIRRFYTTSEVQEVSKEMDKIYAGAERYTRSYRHGNIFYSIRRYNEQNHHLRFVHWPAYQSEVVERYRLSPKHFAVLKPLLGENIKQITNTVSWKTPRNRDTFFGFHQDSRFRRPKSAFRDLNRSYLQMMIAIDAHNRESGCLTVVSGSHTRGELDLPKDKSTMDMEFAPEQLTEYGLTLNQLVDIELEPGDLVAWVPDLVHGSRANQGDYFRRALINGYVKAENAERGEWAFNQERPCTLGDPRLIQYEELYERPEPHYVDGSPYPFR